MLIFGVPSWTAFISTKRKLFKQFLTIITWWLLLDATEKGDRPPMLHSGVVFVLAKEWLEGGGATDGYRLA